jgi:hypothetical protein
VNDSLAKNGLRLNLVWNAYIKTSQEHEILVHISNGSSASVKGGSFLDQCATSLEYLDLLSDSQPLKKDPLKNLVQAITLNLGRNYECPDRGFCGFPQSLQTNGQIVSQIRPRSLPCGSFPIHYSRLFLSLRSRVRVPMRWIFFQCT